MANFNKAIEWLKEGKGIKRTNWTIDGEVHLILKKVNNEMDVFDSYGKSYRFAYDDTQVKNWIIYKDRKVSDGVE